MLPNNSNDVMIRDIQFDDYKFYSENIRSLTETEFAAYIKYVNANSKEKTFIFVDNNTENPIAFCSLSITDNHFGRKAAVEHFFCHPKYEGLKTKMITRLITYSTDNKCSSFSINYIKL